MPEAESKQEEARVVTIAYQRYKELIGVAMDMEALKGMGVDNWQGFGEVDWPTDADVERECTRLRQLAH